MIARLLALLAPPWPLPTWKGAAFALLVILLAGGWWIEHAKYEDLLQVAIGRSNQVVACETGLTARVEEAEAKVAPFLRAYDEVLGRARPRVPAHAPREVE